MLFSIIIPAYNAEKYLPECLASVDAQTFKDYEVVIVDDGSTDETAYIADTYADSKSNVTVLHRENQGPLPARRAGLKISRGQYAVFVDSDDGLHPEALQCIYEQMRISSLSAIAVARILVVRTLRRLCLPVCIREKKSPRGVNTCVKEDSMRCGERPYD